MNRTFGLLGAVLLGGSSLLLSGTAQAATASSSCDGAVPCAIQYKWYGGDTVTVGNDQMGSYSTFCNGPREESCMGQTNYATMKVTWSAQASGTVCITAYLTQGRAVPVSKC